MTKKYENKQVYEMYRGKMCMKHTIEMFTPIMDKELGYKMVLGQTNNSEAHKQSMQEINKKIEEVLGDNFNADIGKIETTVYFGEIMK